MKTTLTIEVEFDETLTDAESVATAADKLLETALSTPDILAEYGDPKFGEFLTPEAPKKKGVIYESVFVVKVLTDEPLDGYIGLGDLAIIGEEEGVVSVKETHSGKLEGKEAADACYAAGSEPAYFQMDEDGNVDE
jgi:hypothetical protein